MVRRVLMGLIALLVISVAIFPLIGVRGGGGLFVLAQGREESGKASESPMPCQTEFSNAEDLMKEMQKRMDSIKDYWLKIYYADGNVDWILDYRCVRPTDIRVQLLDGPKNRGAILLYLPKEREGYFKAKKGIFRAWKSVEELNLKNSPLDYSLLDWIMDELKSYPQVVLKGKEKVTLTTKIVLAESKAQTSPSPEASESPNPSGSPESMVSCSPEAPESPNPSGSPESASSPSPSLSPESPSPIPTPSTSPSSSPAAGSLTETVEPGKSPEPSPSPAASGLPLEKVCYVLEFIKDNIIDRVYVDAETLYIIKRTKAENGKVIFDASCWDIKINTDVKIEF